MRKALAVLTALLIGPLDALALSVAIPGPGISSAVAPIGTPVAIGSNTAASGTTLVITTTANAPAGSVIVVGCISNLSFTTIAATDGTNSYSTAVAISNSDAILNSVVLGGQLNSGSSITVTSGATLDTAFCAAAYVAGLSTATADKTAASSLNTVTTATLTQANEIAFGMILVYNGGSPPGAVTLTSGFTALTTQLNYGAQVFTGVFAYKIVNATTAVTFSWTVPVATAASTIVATYKGN